MQRNSGIARSSVLSLQAPILHPMIALPLLQTKIVASYRIRRMLRSNTICATLPWYSILLAASWLEVSRSGSKGPIPLHAISGVGL